MNNITVIENNFISIKGSALYYGISDGRADFSGNNAYHDLIEHFDRLDDDELSEIYATDIWVSFNDDNDNEYIMHWDWRSDNFKKILPSVIKLLKPNLDDEEIEEMIENLCNRMFDDVDSLADKLLEKKRERGI